MLLFVALFIIANTVRITMFTRRLEISIMKAVAPQILYQVALYGGGHAAQIISASLSVGLVFLIYRLAVHIYRTL